MIKRINPWVALIVAAVAIFLLFKLASFALQLLSWVAIPLVIVTLFIKKDVILDYGKWLWRSFQPNPLLGIVFTLLTIVGFPLVSLFLFLKALNYDKWQSMKGGFAGRNPMGRDLGERTVDADFEIIDEEPLILKERKAQRSRRS